MFTDVNNPVVRRIRTNAFRGLTRGTILSLHCAYANKDLSPYVFSKIFTYAVLFLVDKKGLSVLQPDYLYYVLPAGVASWFVNDFYRYFNIKNIVLCERISRKR